MQPLVVQQTPRDRPRAPLLVINFSTSHFNVPANCLLYAFEFLRRLLDRNTIHLHLFFGRRRVLRMRSANAHHKRSSANKTAPCAQDTITQFRLVKNHRSKTNRSDTPPTNSTRQLGSEQRAPTTKEAPGR